MQAIHGSTAIRVPASRPAVRRSSPAVYRRRRLVAMLLIVSLSFLAWSGLRQLADASGGGSLTTAGRSVGDAQLIQQTTVKVQPGDTLWSIGRRVQPTGDVRPLVSALDAARGSRPLQVGESIRVPR